MSNDEKIAYYKQRAKNHAFQGLMRSFAEAAKRDGLTKIVLANRLGWDRSKITHFFSGPSAWTLEDMCAVAAICGCETSIEFYQIADLKVAS